jgi:hypothetical protein
MSGDSKFQVRGRRKAQEEGCGWPEPGEVPNRQGRRKTPKASMSEGWFITIYTLYPGGLKKEGVLGWGKAFRDLSEVIAQPGAAQELTIVSRPSKVMRGVHRGTYHW